MIRRFSKGLLWTAAGLLFVAIALAAFSQTALFRDALRSELYSLAAENLDAEIYLGTIEGNLVTGFRIDTIAVSVRGTPFVLAHHLSVRYDPFQLWRKRIALGDIHIDNPDVRLIRYRDGSWNVDHLAKKKALPDTTPSPWVVTIRNLVITGGKVRLIDSTSLSDSPQAPYGDFLPLNYSDLDIEHVGLQVSGIVGEREQSVTIRNLTLNSPREGINVSHLSGELLHSTGRSEVRNFIVTTSGSHIELSARMDGVDVFAIRDLRALRSVPVKLAVSGTTIATEEIRKFIPALGFLSGSVYLDVAAEGKFGDLRLTRCLVSTRRTAINFEGTIANLDHPDDLTLDLESRNSIINMPDVAALLPYFGVPSFPELGQSTLNLRYSGKPLDFRTTARLLTSAGDVTVEGRMNLTGPVITYKADVKGDDVDLRPVASDPDVETHLFFTASVEGAGTSLEELNSTLTARFDTSEIAGVFISRLRLGLTARDRDLTARIEAASPRGSILTTASLQLPRDAPPLYRFTAEADHFDLSTILRSERFKSSSSFTLDGRGEGVRVDDMAAEATLRLGPSTFGSHVVDSSLVSLSISVDSSGDKNFKLSSPIADCSLHGRFSYAGLTRAFTSRLKWAAQAYRRERARFDSTFVLNQAGAARGVPDSAGTREDVEYAIHLKNLEPVAVLLGESQISGSGTIEGAIKVRGDSLDVRGSVAIASGRYLDSGPPILLERLRLDYAVSHWTHDLDGAPPTVSVEGGAENLYVGETWLSTPTLSMSFNEGRAEYSLHTGLDTTLHFDLGGTGLIEGGRYALTLTRCIADLQGYELRNSAPVNLTIDAAGLRVDSTRFVHQDETLDIALGIGVGRKIAGFVAVRNFALQHLFYFGRSSSFRTNALAFGGTATTELRIAGTLDEPKLSARLIATGISYRGSDFGTVTGDLEYSDLRSTLSLLLRSTVSADSSRFLSLSGSAPMDLSLRHIEERFTVAGLDLVLRARDFRLSIVDPFVEELTDIDGTFDGSIHCTGSLANPDLEGHATINNGQFAFALNGMTYRASGSLDFHRKEMTLTSVQVRNLPEDYPKGLLTIGGVIGLRGFVPHEYNLDVRGELMALQGSVRRTDQSLYGDLVAATGPDGLKFSGSAERSLASGTILVRQALLTFPPTRQAISSVASRYFREEVIDDTTHRHVDTLLSSTLAAFVSGAKGASSHVESSILDNLSYEIEVRTQGTVQVSMVFNQTTNEELFADLNGRLMLSKQGDNVRLTGTINVSDRSYYTFYKKFAASGSLIFTGPPDNPQLDINAEYDGTHKKTVAGPDSAKLEQVAVSLKITGTRYEPKLKLGLTTTDVNGITTDRVGDVEGDAIAFLLTSSPGNPGKFRDDLTSNDKAGIASAFGNSIGNELISGYANTLLSGLMIDFLRSNNITFVSSAEVRYVGSQADLRLSGELLKSYWSFGGRIFNDINNANISVQLPLGPLFGNDQIRNLMVELERKTDPIETNDSRRSSVTGARIYYRIVF